MKISIDGESYTVSTEQKMRLLEHVHAFGLKEYAKLSQEWRFIAKPVARKLLQDMENRAREKHGKEAALIFRPDKKQDAVLHLFTIMLGVFAEALKDVSLSVTATDHLVTALSLTISGPGEGGGQMAADGDERLRKDDEPEILGRGVHEAVSDGTALHSGQQA